MSDLEKLVISTDAKPHVGGTHLDSCVTWDDGMAQGEDMECNLSNAKNHQVRFSSPADDSLETWCLYIFQLCLEK